MSGEPKEKRDRGGSASLRKDAGCFVCGPENDRGLQAVFCTDAPSRRAESRLRIPAWTQGWSEVVHGGVLATLLDEACVHAVRTLADLPVTAELSVKYRRPVPVESEIVVWAEVIEQKKRIVEVRAKIEIDGAVHAEALAKVFLKDG